MPRLISFCAMPDVAERSSRLIDLEGIELRTKLQGSSIQITRAAIDARELASWR